MCDSHEHRNPFTFAVCISLLGMCATMPKGHNGKRERHEGGTLREVSYLYAMHFMLLEDVLKLTDSIITEEDIICYLFRGVHPSKPRGERPSEFLSFVSFSVGSRSEAGPKRANLLSQNRAVGISICFVYCAGLGHRPLLC